MRATIELLRSAGRDAVNTRSVSAAVRVQSPTVYRHFGDMRGLLKAAVDRAFADYLQAKASRSLGADPVEDLRRACDRHHEFGMANPGDLCLNLRRAQPSPSAHGGEGGPTPYSTRCWNGLPGQDDCA